MNSDNDTNKAVPSDLSDHDERDEGLATEKHWDQESHDPAAIAAERLNEFQKDGVPLSDQDWEDEEKNEELSDHIDAAVDQSLEALVDKEMSEES